MGNPSSLIIYLQQIFLDSGRREKPGVSLPIEPVSQWTIPEKKNREERRVDNILF